jgi:glycosyltransferase involved in cell wall biosynthesis
MQATAPARPPRAAPPPVPRGPSVIAALAHEDASAWWRIVAPLSLLARAGYPARWWPPSACEAAGWGWELWQELQLNIADVVIMPRRGERLDLTAAQRAGLEAWIARRHARGTVVLGDYDDDLFSPAYVIHGRALQRDDLLPEGSRRALERDRQESRAFLRRLDGLTVSTERLAAVVRRYTDVPVLVVENSVPWDWFTEACAAGTRASAQLTIGWVGGPRPDADLAMMAAAWTRVAKRHRDVDFVVAGHQPAVLVDAVPAGRLTLRASLDMEYYPRLYHGVDIGCAPLADTLFNRSKSPIKAFEYGAAGAAVVASPTVYGTVLEDGRTGLLAASVDEWEAALAMLITDTDLRQRLATAWARQVAERHSLEATLWKWPAAWQQLVDAFRARQQGRP